MNSFAKNLFSYARPAGATYQPAPFLPMSRAEMDALGWDSCDIIIVCGDAYVDHPSFGMAVIGRFLESQGFRVGIIAQPDWRSAGCIPLRRDPGVYRLGRRVCKHHPNAAANRRCNG